jgi:hypothetical protein
MLRKKAIFLLLPLIVGGVFVIRWRNSPRHFLETSDQVIFYSLNPNNYVELPSGALVKQTKGETFHSNSVLGKVVITDPAEKEALVNSLFDSLSDGSTMCHEPRHGIRAVRGNQKMDLTVCFMCSNVYFYPDGQPFYEKHMSGSAKKLFNATLRKHHLRLAKE